MRLIDAEALLDDIRAHSESYFADDFAREWVDKQPIVDAVPVRHGHYVGEADGYANGELIYDTWKCSECGCVFEDDYEKPTYNYCPNCGADMRGEEECAKS